MDFLWIAIAFACGFMARQLGLPPLVGYLLAGFGLHAADFDRLAGLDTLADLGITLMLFTIGLKLKISDLIRPPVWGGTFIHVLAWCPTILVIALIAAQFLSGAPQSWQNLALIAFALSFSSTVCVMKILEDSSELRTRHGDIAIGVLVFQDILAVLFLVFSTGSLPSIWALLLPLVYFLRPVFSRVLLLCGHGELLVLVGFFIALGGYELFSLVNIKGDLGALLVGMLIAGLPKSNELYKSLMSLKDLFLVGFFLTIGFAAVPTVEMLAWALVICALLPLKFILFYFIFLSFRLRARTAFLAALTLTNFSEFGLIVAMQAVDLGLMPEQQLVIIALAVSVSFVASSFLCRRAHSVYGRYKHILARFENPRASLVVDKLIPDATEVIICGLGRVGSGAYENLSNSLPGKVCALEVDQERVLAKREQGINVFTGDADDIEFWEYQNLTNVRLIMLAMPAITEMKNVIRQLREVGYPGRIAAVARYDDERTELLELGADLVFNYYSEVGAGFAQEAIHLLAAPESGSSSTPAGAMT